MSTAQQRGRRTVRHEPGTVDDDVVIHTFARQQAVQRGIYQQRRQQSGQRKVLMPYHHHRIGQQKDDDDHRPEHHCHHDRQQAPSLTEIQQRDRQERGQEQQQPYRVTELARLLVIRPGEQRTEHNTRQIQRRQRRQRHAEIHSGLPHQSSSSRRCAETRHYTAEPAAVPLTPVAIHHRLFPWHMRCPIIVDLSYSHASGTLPRPHACTVQEGFPYGTELSRVAGNRHRDHRVRPQARCDPDHHRGRRGDCARRRHRR